ncbi:MAG: helix-turn-helix domain-containing protein [Pseudomonadota bacterium]
MDNISAGLQRIAFDTRSVSAARKADYWIDKVEAFFDVERLGEATPARSFDATLTLVQCNDLIFGEVTAAPQLYSRNRKRLILDQLDHFIVQVFLEGGGPIDGGEVVRPGDMIVIDMGRPHTRDSWLHHHLSFVIPRDRDPELTRLLDRMHERRLPRDHPLVRLITAQMTLLWRYQFDMNLTQMGLAIDSSLALFKTALGDDASLAPYLDETEASPAFAHALRAFIEANLHREVSPTELCAKFNVSRAQLYRMFAENGGVRRYIQDRRLRSAYRMLATGGERLSVMNVAGQTGFRSESHFARAFKARFGATPSETRRDGARPLEPVEGDRALLDGWLRTLQSGPGALSL